MYGTLCTLAKKYVVDKCPSIAAKYPTHTYTPEYDKLLGGLRHTVKSVLEIGIGNKPLMCDIIPDYVPGCSLKMWRDYFPNAAIYGCDIVESVLFSDERIKTFYVDQSNSASLETLRESVYKDAGATQIDFIIDDGSHQKDHQQTTFETLWSALSVGGIYIIEDVGAGYMDYFEQLPVFRNFTNCKLLKKHYGAWSGDNFIAFQKV
jgi:hypothetical protein